jgi:hypothetical protein
MMIYTELSLPGTLRCWNNVSPMLSVLDLYVEPSIFERSRSSDGPFFNKAPVSDNGGFILL